MIQNFTLNALIQIYQPLWPAQPTQCTYTAFSGQGEARSLQRTPATRREGCPLEQEPSLALRPAQCRVTLLRSSPPPSAALCLPLSPCSTATHPYGNRSHPGRIPKALQQHRCLKRVTGREECTNCEGLIFSGRSVESQEASC